MNGLMSHTITVLRPTVTQDAIGGHVVTYTTLATVKGRIPGGSSTGKIGKGIENIQVQSITAMLPVLSTIQLKDVLLKDGIYYEIQTLCNRGGHHIEAEVERIIPDVSRV